jgi:arginine-tRNA-protein transferase
MPGERGNQPMLNQAFQIESVPVATMDQLWAAGWRHFGIQFFRYSHTLENQAVKNVQPLRIRLSRFRPSKSQRRILRQLDGVSWTTEPADLRPDTMELFHRHKQRFTENVPPSLRDFLSEKPASVPCPCLEFRVMHDDALVAASFLDTGRTSTSSLYGLFEPSSHVRSAGILTMLLEIQWSLERGCDFYYPGYSTREPGLYDYKKRFSGLEGLDWSTGRWEPL